MGHQVAVLAQSLPGARPDRIGLGLALAVLTFATWSTNDAIVKWVSGGYSVFLIVFVITGFAVIPAAALVGATGLRSLRPRYPLVVLVRAVILLASTLCIFTALRSLTMAEAYTIVFTSPLIITLLSVPVLGEKVGWRRSVAVAVGFAGVLVMLRPGMQTLGTGHLAALGCALTYSAGALIVRRYGAEAPAAMLTPMVAVKLAASAILVTVVDGWVMPNLVDLLLMAAAGLCYGTGHILFILAFRYAPAAIVAPFQYSQMVWATVFGIVLFGNWPDGFTLLGATVVVGSGLYIAARENTLRKRRA